MSSQRRVTEMVAERFAKTYWEGFRAGMVAALALVILVSLIWTAIQ